MKCQKLMPDPYTADGNSDDPPEFAAVIWFGVSSLSTTQWHPQILCVHLDQKRSDLLIPFAGFIFFIYGIWVETSN